MLRFKTRTKIKLPPIKMERDTKSISRAQRLSMRLADDPRFADIPNFADRLKALSPSSTSKIDTALSQLSVKGNKRFPQAALIAAALSSFSEKDFADPAKRNAYRELRRMQLNSQEPATRGGRQKVSPTGGDKRRYDPTGKDHARTRYGEFARYAVGSPFASSWMQVFRNPTAVIPCIQRKSRREVMFAKGKAGRGYKVKHRRNIFSGVPC